MKLNIKLESENNDFFREWIIEEWKHHNSIDHIYQLRIINPEDVSFATNEKYFKIINNEEMVGFIGIKESPKEIYLFRIFINESNRGKGIGTIALNKLIDIAKESNKDLILDVLEGNPAQKLYESVGFKNYSHQMVLKINNDINMDPDGGLEQ